MRIQGLFLSVILIAGAAAQTPLKFADSSAQLKGPWMFFPGDNPRWAEPDLDDSQWTPMDLTVSGAKSSTVGFADFVPGWQARGFPGLTGYGWYRLSVRPQGPSQDLWLLMPESVDDAYELYVNGKLIGSFGDVRPGHQAAYNARAMLFHMPQPGADGMLHLAIRMFMMPSTPLTNDAAGGLHAPPILGLHAPLQAMFAESRDAILRNYLGGPIMALPLTLFGILACSLFLFRRDRLAYLWLGLCSVVDAAMHVFLAVAAVTFAVPSPFLNLVLFSSEILISLLWLFFWVWWFGLEKRKYLWLSGLALTALHFVCICIVDPPVRGWVVSAAWVSMVQPVELVCRSSISLLLVVTAVIGIRKQKLEGWLTLPALLARAVGMLSLEFTSFYVPLVYFPLGIQVTLASIVNLVCFMLTGALLIRRFMRELKAHTLLQNEVRNAQQVQQVLVPNELEPFDNFVVDAVYVPAREVGGDFFQAIPCEDGSLLAVIGDVSGKGIPAAMVVALVIGALRTATQFTTSPTKLLGMLNDRLNGRMKSGFATCLIARISPTGELEMANAAHLSPYLNGEEIALEPEMPLGISYSAVYHAVRRRLNPGDRLTFVSDGVVEARGESGELFGFERTKAISQRPAREIVAAAKAHGQDDDITVLTIKVGQAVPPDSSHGESRAVLINGAAA
jgi:hypothetical protein